MILQRPIIVLGMHRSGTSALTGLLGLHGVELGPRLMPATSANESGYYEHEEITNVNERLLQAWGRSWDDVRSMPRGWVDAEQTRPHRERLARILRRDFAGVSLWGLKDPRMCRLLPLWLPLLAEFRCEPSFVLLARHPSENVKSLEKRDGFSRGKSELLWLQHTLESERWTRGLPRAIVTFENLLADPETTFARIARDANIPSLKSYADVSDHIRCFLDPAKRHHRAEENENSLSTWTQRAWTAIKAAATGEQNVTLVFDELNEALRSAGELFEPLLSAQGGELRQELDYLRTQCARAVEAKQQSREKLKAVREKLARKSADLSEKKMELTRLKKSWPGKAARLLRQLTARPAS